MCENYRAVIAAQEVPLPTTQGQEGEVLLVTAALIGAQAAEEEDQKLFIFKTGDKVLHFGVIEEKLALVVDVVKVLPDSWFGALALDVGGGGSGRGEAGGQAV